MAENIHDKGYKRLFSNKQFFQELIETFVTEDWVKDIDFRNCQKVDKSVSTLNSRVKLVS